MGRKLTICSRDQKKSCLEELSSTIINSNGSRCWAKIIADGMVKRKKEDEQNDKTTLLSLRNALRAKRLRSNYGLFLL
uniref:Uncharacterized protein n=1 Tax=Cannabis sativa TaxID=3483 RepID=A0A803NYW3_CANSA